MKNPEEPYLYTFQSLLAFQILFDLSLSALLMSIDRRPGGPAGEKDE
ncbi:MAG: hypothetical protein IMZ61_04265 [Planctomycetes bacterium]|nr:hypothetical protein [Planctomycetota bacterium]